MNRNPTISTFPSCDVQGAATAVASVRDGRSFASLWHVALSGLFVVTHGASMAGTGSCVGTGAISVSSPVVGECSLDNGDSLTVTSGGSITGDGTPATVGVRVNGGVSGVQIVNDGSIVGDPSDGINNAGSIDRITNRGVIRGGSSFATGLYNGGGGTITEFNNEAGGVVESAGGQPNAIQNDSTLSTLNNAGEIRGGIQTTNTTINITGGSSSISGAVSNVGGSVNLLSGADFTTGNTFTSDTFSVASGATLRIGSSAHTLTVNNAAVNAFNNSGTLRVPEGVVANITGNYQQSGAVRLGASSTSSFGRVAVTGDAVLTPTATFVVDVNATNSLANGQSLAGVVSASGTLTNNAPASNVSDNSALFDFRSGTNGNAVDLSVVAVGTTPSPAPAPAPSPAPAPAPQQGVGIVPAVQQNALPSGVPAAYVLDGYIRGGTTGTDWDNVVTALGKLPTNRLVAEAVGQSLPLMHGSAGLVGLIHGARTGSVIEQQRAMAGKSGGDGVSGRGLWVRPLGNWVEQDTVADVSGYKMGTFGLVGGAQVDLNAVSTLGLGLAYLNSQVDGKRYAAGHGSDIESVQAIGYGQYALGSGGWQLAWQGDYTRSRFETVRTLSFIDRVAQARYDGDAWHFGVEASRNFVMERTTVKPMVALDWRQFESDGYAETGAGALSLQTSAQKAREAILKVGAQMQYEVNAQTQWLARVALGHDLSDQSNAVTARFSGGGVAFTTQGLPQAKTVAELGLGLRYRASEGMSVVARYDLALRKGLQDQSATVRLDWRF